MYTVFLAGGIASGKSSVARELERRGAWRIDLDQVSRAVLEPGSDCLPEIADAFGDDLLDPQTGELDRGLLAGRAFADPASCTLLEKIEMPHIKRMLVRMLEGEGCCLTAPVICVVEVPLLDRVEDMLDLADEVVCVTCPVEVRRVRAIGRGMDGADFDRRAANQPSEGYLRAHADTVIDNAGGPSTLMDAVDAWWCEREGAGWACPVRPAGGEERG
ncbi:MAG: dephospho-CoA kinase [Atopobiaceae bacterium]